MKSALIIAAAAVPADLPVVVEAATMADVVIAADGGADFCLAHGIRPDVVVGDMDSVYGGTLGALGLEPAAIRVSPKHKDETDLELAIGAAVAEGATRLTVAGVSGGRFDHALAALGALVAARSLCPVILSAEGISHILAVDGCPSLSVGPNVLFSVLALADGARVDVTGAVWPLLDAPLRPLSPLGVSNIASPDGACVTLREGVALVHLPADTGEQRFHLRG